MKIKRLPLLLILLTFFAGQVFSQNLITNPGFETWTNGAGGPPDGWSLSNPAITAEQEATEIHEGTYSTKLTWTTTSTVRIEQMIDVNPNANYEFNFWALDNDPAGRLRITLVWYDATGAYIQGQYGAYTVDDAAWQNLTSGVQVSPATADSVSVQIRMYDVSGAWSGTATCYVDETSLESAAGATPSIVKAYALSATAMDVFYDIDLSTVDASDYQLSGTSAVSFSSAAIDGSDARILHLTGASTNMLGDLTLDNIHDDANSSDYEFYAGISPIANMNTNNPGGVIQNGKYATFQGIASANDAYNNVWISDAAGQRNGTLIYDSDFDGVAAVGDEIIVTGIRDVYNGLTEIKDPELISTLSLGNTPYGPDVIDASDIEENIAIDTDPGEAWEGQLVKIENVSVVSSPSSHEFVCTADVGGTTYTFYLGDNVDYNFGNISVNVGVVYTSITGVVDWTNSHFRLNPREQADIEGGSAITPTRLVITSVNGGNNPYVDAAFDVSVEVQDDSGNLADVSTAINFTLTSNSGTVGFSAGSTTGGTFAIGENQITLTGVKMTPEGTNVTITADDGVLTPGVSAAFDVVLFQVPEIIISEIIQNPSAVSDTYGEWFELFNTTNATINLNGYIIKDEGTNVDTIKTDLFIPAEGFVVLGREDDSSINGDYTCDYQYSNFYLGNGADKIILQTPAGVEVNRVDYDGGSIWPDPNGKSMVFTGTANDDNNNGALWVEAASREPNYNGSTGDLGSPGTNGDLQNLTAGSIITPTRLVITSVNGGINPTVDAAFEVNVEVQDDSGNLADVSTAINFTLTSNSGTVDFAAGSTTGGSFAIGENQITLTGVIMTPEGTNVTITADDGILTAGISAAFDVVALQTPDLLITEIMQNPAAISDNAGEWFELFNTTGSVINLNGYIIKDDGTNVDTIQSDVFVPALGFVVLGIAADTAVNGAYVCDYEYSNFYLSNGADEIILQTPTGVEVDRVDYDGGAVWPDPNGKSMVYTGTVSDDNNDGTMWVEADMREPSYYYTTGDLGSPGTNGNLQNLIGGVPSNELNLTVFIEGAFGSTEMSTDLNVAGLIPNAQPYSGAPWNYAGTESFASVPNADVVDWVLVEMRDAVDAASASSATVIKTMAGLLLKDGSIVSVDGSSKLSFTNTIANNLYIVIYHRNHVSVMSAVALASSGKYYTYDFTSSNTAAYGTDAQKGVGSVWVMYGGDVDGNGEVDNDDDATIWYSEAGASGYFLSDVNLDGQSDNKDKDDVWVGNVGVVTQVP